MPHTEVWAKPLSDGDWAIALLNRTGEAQPLVLDWANTELKDDTNARAANFGHTTYRMTDAWTGEAAGDTSRPLEVSLAPHDTLVFRLTAN